MAEHHEAQRNGVIALSFAIGAFTLLVIFIVGDSYFDRIKHETLYRQYLSVQDPRIEQLRTQENITLNSYLWRNQEEGTVSIPIERAMNLVVQETSGGAGQENR